jgi:hypothetical protein
MEQGARCPVQGARSMEQGAWCREQGAWGIGVLEYCTRIISIDNNNKKECFKQKKQAFITALRAAPKAWASLVRGGRRSSGCFRPGFRLCEGYHERVLRVMSVNMIDKMLRQWRVHEHV